MRGTIKGRAAVAAYYGLEARDALEKAIEELNRVDLDDSPEGVAHFRAVHDAAEEAARSIHPQLLLWNRGAGKWYAAFLVR